MTDTHRHQNWLIVDYRTGDMNVRKTEPSPSDLGKNELATEVVVDVVVPEPDLEALTATLEVPTPTVRDADVHDLDAAAVRTWQEVADDRLDDVQHMFLDDGRVVEGRWVEHENDIVLDVLEASVDRPAVDDVREYLAEELERRAEADGEVAEA